jgi:hypothetical protein
VVRLALVCLVFSLAWSPRAEAAPSATEGSRAAESGLLAGFQLTQAVLHLVAGLPTQAAPKPQIGCPAKGQMTLLDLEAKVFAGEEGLPPPPPEP